MCLRFFAWIKTPILTQIYSNPYLFFHLWEKNVCKYVNCFYFLSSPLLLGSLVHCFIQKYQAVHNIWCPCLSPTHFWSLMKHDWRKMGNFGHHLSRYCFDHPFSVKDIVEWRKGIWFKCGEGDGKRYGVHFFVFPLQQYNTWPTCFLFMSYFLSFLGICYRWFGLHCWTLSSCIVVIWMFSGSMWPLNFNSSSVLVIFVSIHGPYHSMSRYCRSV